MRATCYFGVKPGRRLLQSVGDASPERLRHGGFMNRDRLLFPVLGSRYHVVEGVRLLPRTLVRFRILEQGLHLRPIGSGERRHRLLPGALHSRFGQAETAESAFPRDLQRAQCVLSLSGFTGCGRITARPFSIRRRLRE